MYKKSLALLFIFLKCLKLTLHINAIILLITGCDWFCNSIRNSQLPGLSFTDTTLRSEESKNTLNISERQKCEILEYYFVFIVKYSSDVFILYWSIIEYLPSFWIIFPRKETFSLLLICLFRPSHVSQ